MLLRGVVPIDLASLEDAVPCKPPTKWSEGPTSPAALVGDQRSLSLALGGSTATLSQPNSATSSLASLLFEADFQLSSRQSSASDLGTRPFAHHHSRLGSSDGSLSARSDRSHEDAVDAIATFDNVKCMALAKVKVPPPDVSSSLESSDRAVVDAPNSPNRMVAVYQNLNGNNDRGDARVPGLTVRPTRVHTNTLPHNATYNPYDLSALLADFKLKKNASPSAGAAPPPRKFTGARLVNRSFSCTGPAVARPSPFVAVASTSTAAAAKPSAPVASAPQEQHRSEGLVMIPGMRRVNTT